MSDAQSAEIRRLEAVIDQLNARIQAAYERLLIEDFDGDSCPDLESTIDYAIARYHQVADAEAEAADQIGDLRVALKQIQHIVHQGLSDRVQPQLGRDGRQS